MAIDSNVLQEVVDALKQDPEIKNNVYQATVSRIDGEGVVWVNIAGSDTETPTAITSAEVAPGDAVNVEWRNNKLYIGGNYSNPSAGVVRVEAVEAATQVAGEAAANAVQEATRAREAADRAEGEAVRAGEAADRAEGKADEAEGHAQTALTNAATASTAAQTALVNLATTEDVVGVLNWITAHGTMTTQSGGVFVPGQVYFISDPAGDYVVGGNHYSVVTEPKAEDIDSYFVLTVDEAIENYVATHVAVDTEGLWIIPDAGGNKVLIATGSGSTYTTAGTYIVGKVGGVDTVLASFAASGVVIGDAAGAHTSIDEDGMQIYSVDSLDNVVNLANIGYGQGTDHDGNTSYAPYYTLGRRIPGSVTGNYSVAEGYFSRADGYASHAEGTASVDSNSFCGHAEGSTTSVLASCGHAEGQSTTVRGDYAHAQNNGTYADRRSHTVIGEYNVRDQSGADGTVRGDYAFIIGNGTADNARSNALTVDWSGNVNIASGSKYKINGTALTAADVGALADTTTYVSGVKGDAEVNYRSGSVNLTAANVNALPISGGTMTSYGQIINGHITNSASRETTPDLTVTGKRGVTALLATGSMTTNSPGRGTILHCEWDDTSGLNSQLFISNNSSTNGTTPCLKIRGQNSGTWTAWDTVHTDKNTVYGELYGMSSSLTLSTSAKKVALTTFSGSGCQLSSNGIKVTNAGTYMISGSAYCSTGYTVNDLIHIQLYKGSTSLCDSTRRALTANPYEIMPVGPIIATLAANDVIYLYAYNQGGARGTVGTNTLTHITLHRIA